jgi:hypothetical protein
MRILIAATALFALAACSTTPRDELPPPQLPQRAGVDPVVAARAEGIEFRATGDGFVLEIYRTERIDLKLAEAEQVLTFPRTEPRMPAWHGSVYWTEAAGRRLEIDIHEGRPCPDGGASVVVRLDYEEFRGCGRYF